MTFPGGTSDVTGTREFKYIMNLAGDTQYASLMEQLKPDLEQWMMEQGNLGMESGMAVPLWIMNN